MRAVKIGEVLVGEGHPLILVAGPCVIESPDHCLRMAEALAELADAQRIPLVFKTSYDKANRTSVHAYRGPGLSEGMKILARVKQTLSLPVLCDVHTPQEARSAADVVDALQIPAFLCRQTDLLLAAAATGKPVNVKKGQFMAPWDMRHVVEKLAGAGNNRILLTERGTCFGYNCLVSDMRALVVMRGLGYPVLFDATHSVQLPGARGETSGGEREFAPPLARAAAAVGMDGLFLEVHDAPQNALCDGPNMLALSDLPALLAHVTAIDHIIRGGT